MLHLSENELLHQYISLQKPKKRVSVSAIFMLVIKANIEVVLVVSEHEL